MSLFIASLVLTGVISFIQTTNWLLFGTLKPDLVLALLIVLTTFHFGWLKRSILIFFSALILKFSPDLDWLDIVFIAALYLSMMLVDYLPWRQIVNLIIAVIVATVIINLGVFRLLPFFYELGSNIAAALIFWLLLKPVYEKKI